jgi:hypothetical protein
MIILAYVTTRLWRSQIRLDTNFDLYFYTIFVLGPCILLRVRYQGYWKNRPSQELFKVYIHIYLALYN